MLLISGAAAEDLKAKSPPPDHSADSDIAHFCTNLQITAAEARMMYQTRKLSELEARMKQQIEALEKQEDAAREWVTKRDAMLKAATDDVIAIYAKMAAEPAANQMSTMDDTLAAGVLAKLKPATASAILAEMDADRAARLTTLMSGLADGDKRT